MSNMSADPLDQVDQNMQNIMEELVQEIRDNSTKEDILDAEKAVGVTTKPSHICDQAAYRSQRVELGHRMGKFMKTTNTSPRFYDNDKEHNIWTRKIQTLALGKIGQIFPDNKRMESLQKLAKHLRS